MKASIKILATKDDTAIVKDDVCKAVLNLKDDLANVCKDIAEAKTETIKWMFIFWIAQIAVTFLIFFYFSK